MQYSAVAIEREYAAGGREIGEKLAKMLGVPCYGREILEKAAEKTGLSVDELSELEESMSGSLLFSLNMLASITSGRNVDLTENLKLALIESDIIKELCENRCVIIGRSAAGLRKDSENTLKVFIHADFDVRIKRAVKVYGVDLKQAETVLRRYDKRRADYFKAVSSVGWKDQNIYHMFLNSGKLGIDSVTDILYNILK